MAAIAAEVASAQRGAANYGSNVGVFSLGIASMGRCWLAAAMPPRGAAGLGKGAVNRPWQRQLLQCPPGMPSAFAAPSAEGDELPLLRVMNSLKGDELPKFVKGNKNS